MDTNMADANMDADGIENERVPYTAIRSPERTNNHATVVVEGDEETFNEIFHALALLKHEMKMQQKDFSYAVIGVKPYPR